MLDSSVLLPYKRRISSISRLYFKSILPGAREIVQLIKNLLWVGFWHLWEKTRYWGVWFLISVSRDKVGSPYLPLPLPYPHTIIYDWSFIVLCSHYLEILRKLLLVFFLAYLCTLCLGKPNFLPPEVSPLAVALEREGMSRLVLSRKSVFCLHFGKWISQGPKVH